jgi:signal transduction histidine kinase
LISVVERTERGARLSFDNELGAILLPVPEALLMEIAGPLLENAARFARTRVRISGGAARLCIEDDGPGLSEAEAATVVQRGKRFDEGGHGLGLAIAQDVANLTGAELGLTRSALGGLQVEVRWGHLP